MVVESRNMSRLSLQFSRGGDWLGKLRSRMRKGKLDGGIGINNLKALLSIWNCLKGCYRNLRSGICFSLSHDMLEPRNQRHGLGDSGGGKLSLCHSLLRSSTKEPHDALGCQNGGSSATCHDFHQLAVVVPMWYTR